MSILNIELFNKEELENERVRYGALVRAFNDIHDSEPDKIDEFSYMDFFRKAGGVLRPEEWLEFLSDYRVSQVLDKIMLIKMRSTVNRILSDVESKSVAGSQRLSAALNFMNKHFDGVMGRESTVYIYTSIPLTKSEELARNAKTLVVKPKVNPHNPANPSSENYLRNEKRRKKNESK